MVIMAIAIFSPALGANGDRSSGSTATEVVKRSETIPNSKSDAFEDFTQGRVSANQAQYAKAIDAFNRAESKGLRLYELFALRGFAYYQIKQYQHAEEDANRAIALEPSRMLGYELLAGVKYAVGNSDDAIKGLTSALTKVEDIEKAKLQKIRGVMLLKLGRRHEAIDDLTHALELGHASVALYSSRGDAYRQLGRYDLALLDYSQALRIKSDDGQALRDRGWTYTCVGELDKAVADFNQVLAAMPGDVVAHGMRGWARLESGDVKGSLDDFTYAMKHGTQDPWTFLGAADAYYLQDNIAKALEVNKQGLALKSADGDYRFEFQRGLFLLVNGEEEEAVRLYKKAEAAAIKRSDPLTLQEVIADLREMIRVQPQITGTTDVILNGLERSVAQTKVPSEPNPNQCQRLRSRDAGVKGSGLNHR